MGSPSKLPQALGSHRNSEPEIDFSSLTGTETQLQIILISHWIKLIQDI